MAGRGRQTIGGGGSGRVERRGVVVATLAAGGGKWRLGWRLKVEEDDGGPAHVGWRGVQPTSCYDCGLKSL